MKQAIVVVPVYQTELSATERASWTQVRRVLSAYDICLLAPESLIVAGSVWDDGIRVERFAERFFQSNNSYSELMLSPNLYERFTDYEYMLVYQLDAFVFSDRLAEFCAMGYDYIGAPLHHWSGHWKDIGCNVGNGGFSLRKISSTLRVLDRKEEIFRQMPPAWEENQFLFWEDLFFSFCATLPELDFHVPDFLTALDFAVGTDIGHAYEKIPSWLPFGCHAWDRTDYRFWKPVIESFGYHLPEPKGQPQLYGRQRAAIYCIKERLLRDDTKYLGVALAEVQSFYPSEGRALALWGSGMYGKFLARMFRLAGIEIVLVFDRKAKPGDSMDGIPLAAPDFDRIREQHVFVMVATLEYEEEICAGLASHGFVEGTDYGRVSVLAERILRAVLRAAARKRT